MQLIKWFKELSINDVAEVGGKNASLGELIRVMSELKVAVPNGFATTSNAYDLFLEDNNLKEFIEAQLSVLNEDNLEQLNEVAQSIRDHIMKAQFSESFIDSVSQAYLKLIDTDEITVAVRSSATAEDLPEASFAGQQETLLNVHGLDDVLMAIKIVYASLFNDRAIVYRKHHGFSHMDVKISAGIQIMVRSDLASSGVMFSIDPETGFKDVVFITSSYGLGETIVQGSVNPDEYCLYKPNLAVKNKAILSKRLGSKKVQMIYDKTGTKIVDVESASQKLFSLTDDEVEKLGQYAVAIEKHYGVPMDIEWAKDGISKKIYIVQARPETVKSRETGLFLENYQIDTKGATVITEGRSIGEKIGKGKAVILKNIGEMGQFKEGSVLVADMTDPDWEPIMAKAAAIVTNRGGRTCHAAIIARELGIPAVVGCGDATKLIENDNEITVNCAEGETGWIYEGLLPFSIRKIALEQEVTMPCKVMMNLGNPDMAFAHSKLPNEGVGLARLEFIISNMIGIHPRALIEFDSLESKLQKEILVKTQAYGDDPKHFYISKLIESISTIAAAFYPKPVIVRMSDFKSNEYASLLGGEHYEPNEENPMIGYRGASRYVSNDFKECFKLECEAIKQVRDERGFNNIKIMIPFVRTVHEANEVMTLLETNGLQRKDGLEIYMMCELPSNALLADDFLELFDGFSIGSNDLTQLTLGLDRDSALIASQFDERDGAVKTLIEKAVKACLKKNKYVGICGQAPSDYPEFADWLISIGIKSMSLNPDTIIPTYLRFSER